MTQYIATMLILMALAMILSACGIRNAPTYDYEANKVEQFRYAPLYE